MGKALQAYRRYRELAHRGEFGRVWGSCRFPRATTGRRTAQTRMSRHGHECSAPTHRH
jgi:hypothetical protein